MRIVSQNRDLSVDFSRCEIWTQSNIIFRRIGTDSRVIGAYATSERAAEVFRDMHNAYSPVGLITCDLTEEQIKQFIGSENVESKVVMMPVENKDWIVSTYDNIVYYMPKE